jgi:hypothetical protein
MHTKDKNH